MGKRVHQRTAGYPFQQPAQIEAFRRAICARIKPPEWVSSNQYTEVLRPACIRSPSSRHLRDIPDKEFSSFHYPSHRQSNFVGLLKAIIKLVVVRTLALQKSNSILRRHPLK